MKGGFLIIAALLSACSCTEGCASLARFGVPVDLQPGTEYRIQACVNGDCSTETLTITDGPATSGGSLTLDVDHDVVELLLGNGDFTDAPDLQLSISSGEVVLAEFSGMVEMGLSRPNGWWCGPTCYFAEVQASAVE
jgi:hypothetical protein